MNKLNSLFNKVSEAVTDRVEGIGEAASAALIGAIAGNPNSGGITVGQNVSGQALVQATPTGMAPAASGSPLGSSLPTWVKPVAVGVAVVVAGALVWRLAGK